MSESNEEKLVEEPMIDKLEKVGWTYIKPKELIREDLSEPLLIKNLGNSIKRINKELDLNQTDINRIISELKGKTSDMQGVKQILRFLKNGIAMKLDKTRELRYVKLIDYEDPENNEFIVSNQFEIEGARTIKIPDVVLFVNGIPVVTVECKNPLNLEKTWLNAYNDIKHYEEVIPELFKYSQFSIAACNKFKYFPNVFNSDNIRIEE
ncbi:MAG: type I restriction endonuclease, partial [Candidatus Aenigmatarchaeota archaeon]